LGKFDLASKVLNAMRLLRPQMTTEYFQFSVWILIKRSEYMEAMRELNANVDGTPQWHAMMCLCLAAMNDPTWNSHAERVLEGDDEPSKALVRGLRGQDVDPASDAVPQASLEMPAGLIDSFGRM
jgi:type III secretion system HrpB1/HrpK family protein